MSKKYSSKTIGDKIILANCDTIFLFTYGAGNLLFGKKGD